MGRVENLQIESQRTAGGSTKRYSNAGRSSQSGHYATRKQAGKSFEINPYEHHSHMNLDARLSEDPEEILVQRKQRFESLRKIQSLMEQTELDRPVGLDFLEEIYRKNELQAEKEKN